MCSSNRIVISENGENKMDDLFGLLRENNKIILAAVIVAAVMAGIVVFRKLFMKKQKEKELSQAAEDKMRDENLNQVILNQHRGGERFREVHRPYDVDYSRPNSAGGRGSADFPMGGEGNIMVQMIERTELSTRKFMMNPVKPIRVGSDLQDNDINVLAEGISAHQFEIFAVRDKVFVKNVSSENRTILRRKKEQAIVDEKGIRMLSGDVIFAGHVSYDITIVQQ